MAVGTNNRQFVKCRFSVVEQFCKRSQVMYRAVILAVPRKSRKHVMRRMPFLLEPVPNFVHRLDALPNLGVLQQPDSSLR
jgi:hypothetical protein